LAVFDLERLRLRLPLFRFPRPLSRRDFQGNAKSQKSVSWQRGGTAFLRGEIHD
jgi:hypothetical protein